MKGQLVGEQNAQEVNALFQLAQMHTLHNGTIRRDSTPGHASTQAVGITQAHTLIYNKYLYLPVIQSVTLV